MKVFQIQGAWGMAHLQLATRPDPRPGPGQVLLRMRAASLNYRDLLVPDRGYGSFTGELPLIPISDGVGEVMETGAGVSRVQPGDRVCPCFNQAWIAGEPRLGHGATLGGPLDGTMAEYMVLPEGGVVKAPAHLSDEKIARAKALGADAAINYVKTPEWYKATREITDGRGYDHIVELGGEKTLPQSLRCIRPGGTLSMIGVLSGGTMSAQLGLVVTRQVRLQGISVGHRDGFEAMMRAIDQHKLRPVTDKVFPFEELKQAMAYLKSGAHFGKVCIRH